MTVPLTSACLFSLFLKRLKTLKKSALSPIKSDKKLIRTMVSDHWFYKAVKAGSLLALKPTIWNCYWTSVLNNYRRVMELCRWKELRITCHSPDWGLSVLQLPRWDLNPPLEVIMSNIDNQVVLLSLSCCLFDDDEGVKRCWITIKTRETESLSPLEREVTYPTKWQWLGLRAHRWIAWA